MWQQPGELLRWHRAAVLSLVTVLASGVAVASWAMWSSPSEPFGTVSPARETDSDKTVVTPSTAADQHDFDRRCLAVMHERLFRLALRGCAAFHSHPHLGAIAHAVTAAIYTDASYRDTAASIKHAQRAVELGEPRALFLMASHLLAGHLPDAKADAVELLRQAQAKGVAGAEVYLRAVSESRQCRLRATALPLGHPLFCLFRAELHQLLLAQGVQLRRQDSLLWQDDLSPGDALGHARSMLLEFDIAPSDGLHRLARLSYVFDAGSGSAREDELATSLTTRYGAPSRPPAASGLWQWTLPDGVVIRLEKSVAHEVTLIYENTQRWQTRATHLRAQQARVNADRIKAEVSLL